jgi:hypothetical protein
MRPRAIPSTCVAALSLACIATGCTMNPRQPVQTEVKTQTISIEPRIPLIPTYPCSGCHATRTPRPERHKLVEFHVVRNAEFSHGADAFWCYQCHSLKDVDHLVTSTGEPVTFDEAWRVCTSCHGDKLDDWKAGLHGLILGDWNGVKHKKSCPACHNPHDPRYPSIEPERMPAPIRKVSPL